MNNIWTKLKKPFFCLAPMEDVTDSAFRQMVTKLGKPDIFFTEFLNTDALNSEGAQRVIHRFVYKKNEHPIIAQIWGKNPENYMKAVKVIKEMGFDGVDINMACPVKKIIKQGSCSGLINNHSLAKELIQATQETAKDLPISVKTRIGYDKIQTEEWIDFLLSMNLDAITIHGRTKKDLYKNPANWEEIGKAVEIRNQKKSKTLIIGNGDIKSKQEGLKKVEKYGVDGVMIGRGILNNLFLFKDKDFSALPLSKKLKLAQKHFKIYQRTWGETKKFANFKKYFSIYIRDFKGASELRTKLMTAQNVQEAQDIINLRLIR